MNMFLSESITVAILLTLVFGAICFYLYTRVSYSEKRVMLIESILLDIKMNMENMMKEEPHYIAEPTAAPAVPIAKDEVENIPEEEAMYQNVLQNSGEATEAEPVMTEETAVGETKVSVNYESMTKAELTSLCEKRGVKVGKRPGRNDLINALRKNDGESAPTETVQEVEGASFSVTDVFPLAAKIEEVSA
jgi:hypothetical protein